MANREIVIYDDEMVDVYMAFRRKKDNNSLASDCIRQIIRDPILDLGILKLKLKSRGGIWRIHKTVNKRSVSKAWRQLQHKIIDDPEIPYKLESAWKTVLLQPASRGERKFMLDIDTLEPDHLELLNSRLKDNNIQIIESFPSPNGYHFVTLPFDVRIVNDLHFVSIHRDGYVFLELFNS